MADLIDLEQLDAATVKRARAALGRWQWAQKSPAERTAATAAARTQMAKTGRRRRRETKGQAQQRTRKAAETRARRYPPKPRAAKPVRPCLVCDCPTLCKGLCGKHWKQWRRSGIEDPKVWAEAHGQEREPAA